jgi:hypothetical protein
MLVLTAFIYNFLEILGGVDIVPYNGEGGEGIDEASELNCDFSKPCCWSNVNSPTDQLDWGLANSDVDPDKAESLLGTEGPRAPYLITSSQATSSFVYADFFSCMVPCQNGPGTLTFK